MKTEIYPNYSAFLDREDKTINGVTQEFADANPNWAEERGNEGCLDCSGCSGCSRCSRCSDCSDLKNAWPVEAEVTDSKNPLTNIPAIPNIHQKVLDAVTAPGHALKMDNWHSCNTTHCRGGWVVTLAGPAGAALEEATTTEFAAMQIYKASSPIRVSPVRFYETNEVALADIQRCAKEEAELATK